MIILEDERKEKTIDICTNCKEVKRGRQIEAFGWVLESRGFYFVCFSCFGPRIRWQKTEKSREVWSSCSAFSTRQTGNI